jgi:hypothetical protein
MANQTSTLLRDGAREIALMNVGVVLAGGLAAGSASPASRPGGVGP